MIQLYFRLAYFRQFHKKSKYLALPGKLFLRTERKHSDASQISKVWLSIESEFRFQGWWRGQSWIRLDLDFRGLN